MGNEIRAVVPVERIEDRILFIRGEKVILDSDLAELYGVTTSRLNEQVKRNKKRFPVDFMFQLSKDEYANLKSHFATSSSGWGGRRKLPYAFTEHGVIMAASVLNSERAIGASVFVVRAFVRLRQMLAPYKELMDKFAKLERRVRNHDKQIIAVIEAIELLMAMPEDELKEPFGFRPKKRKD